MHDDFRSFQWIWGILAVSVFAVFTGCDLFNSDDPPQADEVVVIGTQVGADFQRSGEFGLSATPLDPEGHAILSDDIDAEVHIEHPNSSSASKGIVGHIEAMIDPDDPVEPSGNPLVASVAFDGSNSLDDHDEPERNRVEGGKAFIDELENGDTDYEAAIFEYSGTCFPNPDNFQCTDMLQDFTSDPIRLKGAIEQVGTSGETPTYGSLLEILEYAENERPSADYEKVIVLFSDGLPNDRNLEERRASVCEEVKPSRKNSPIFAVGLGPGSDLDDRFFDPEAVEEMNRIANCSGGSYAGIDPANPRQAAQERFSAVGTAATKGFISFNVIITSGLEDFETGDVLRGTLSVTSGGETAEGSFSFRVPAEDMAMGAFHYSR